MDTACQVGTVQGHSDSIVIWSVFSWHCFGSLVRLPIFVNLIRYVELLATGWLDEHFSDFPVINWPPRSQDLNSIENLRDVLEQSGKDHHIAPTNLSELWTVLANT
ncbi:transposable element Tcb2 transposase [Trichonephila clavipes]|nr:transposable element Tcb2 transposase [Trichonephila clavipes]